MKFAVASQNRRTVTGHAGQTRRFTLFEAEPGRTPVVIGHLDLAKDEAIHNFRGDGPHPIDGVQVLIAGSCGEGFVRRMESRGIRVAATAETDPATAVRGYLDGTLKPPAPHAHGAHEKPHGSHHHEPGTEGVRVEESWHNRRP